MQKNSFKIYTLGCKVNQYDSNSFAGKLIASGFIMKKNNADLAIINTCTVTKSALVKDRQMIRRARKENPGAKLIVAGCGPKVYKKTLTKAGADYIMEGMKPDDFISKFSKHEIQAGCDLMFNSSGRSRYFLKIQDGCRQFCSYCIIPYTRGELNSRPAEEVLAEVAFVVKQGFKEIILCGIHLGLYGQELKVKSEKLKVDLASLLRKLVNIKGLERIRLSSIEATEVNDELIKLMKTNRKICRQLHLPLQSGNDKILKLMNRPYTTKFFSDKIKKIRQTLPDIAITTDVIVGFPGESEQDFRATEKFIKKMNFSQLHVFPFSAHEQTPAAKMPGQLDEKIKTARSKKLNNLNEKLEQAYQSKFINKPLGVIIDGRSRDGKYRGKTEYYFDLEFYSQEKYRAGDLVQASKWKLL